jgi:FkbM family methyltransferase
MNWWCRRPPGPFLAEAAGVRFVCDLRDSTAREAYFTARYEPQETALVRAILRPGGTFVDVGANWGYFTLLAAGLVGSAGRVVSVEPDPRLFALLEANLAANRLVNVRAVRAAAAAAPGEVRLAGFDPAGGNWGLTRVDPAAGSGFTARAATIDAELDAAGVGRVDLLKMDIEGAEDAALAGMAAGLRAGRYARLLVELHPGLLAARGASAEAVIDGLVAAGYGAWEIRHDRATTRRAAYARSLDPQSVLAPWAPGRPVGPWPHFLFAPEAPLP